MISKLPSNVRFQRVCLASNTLKSIYYFMGNPLGSFKESSIPLFTWTNLTFTTMLTGNAIVTVHFADKESPVQRQLALAQVIE
jgi:hypothetical protein